MIESSDDIIKEIDPTIKLIKIAEKNIYTVMPSFTILKMLNQLLLLIIFLPMLKCLLEIKKDF